MSKDIPLAIQLANHAEHLPGNDIALGLAIVANLTVSNEFCKSNKYSLRERAVLENKREKIRQDRKKKKTSATTFCSTSSSRSHKLLNYISLSVESKTRTYNGRSGRDARRGDGAVSGRTRRRQNISPRKQASLAPSTASKTRRLNVPPETRTSECLRNPVEKHNEQLTSG